MQRTKAIGLLYKQLRKDSCISRQGIPDYLVTMRKPGENASASHENARVVSQSDKWQNYASPVWMDINAIGHVCSGKRAREDNGRTAHLPASASGDRARESSLWTNPG